MLSFFKINDPYRLIGVFIILILFRLPYWLGAMDMTLPQLTWQLVGYRLSEGFIMYRDVWDSLSPFSAGTYWIIYNIFGSASGVAMEVFGILLLFVQASIFNSLLIKNHALAQNTYIPAVIYTILGSLYFDFLSFSPVLLGITFILLALNNVFSQIEIRVKRDEKILNTGLYLGIAALFHFPFIIFGLGTLLVFFLFTATVRRRYFLLLFGWILPPILMGLYYWFNDSFFLMWKNHVLPWFIIDGYQFMSVQLTFAMVAIPGVMVLLSFFRLFRSGSINNYQSRLIQAMFVILLISCTLFIVEFDRNPFVLFAFVPPVAFFISHYFTLSKKGFWGELTFILFIGLVGFFNFQSLYLARGQGQSIFDVSTYFVSPYQGQQQGEVAKLEGKKIAVFGEEKSKYYQALPATPFIDWRISQRAWIDSKKYRNLEIIAASIDQEKPEVILDPEGYFQNILPQAPGLKKLYEQKEDNFYLIPSN